MRLPYVTPSNARRKQQTMRFAGVNYGDGVADGELENSRNVTSERFPCLSPRGGRNTEGGYENATAVWYKDGLLVVDGSDLIYNGEVVGAVSPGKKQFATINTQVVIMPDKLVLDTKTSELRSMVAEYTIAAGTAVFNSDRITAHIGNYAEFIVGSGNVGGNDKLGKDNPTFMGDAPPFSKVYQSASINEATGAFEFGAALTGSDNTAENVEVGYAFIDSALGADGKKRFGRITKKTKFVHPGLQEGVTYHTWNRYKTVTNEMTTTNLLPATTYEKAVSTGFTHSVVSAIGLYRMPIFYTHASSGTLKLVFGNGVTIGNDGYFRITNGKTVAFNFDYASRTELTDVDIGAFYRENTTDPYAVMYIGLMDNNHINSYIKMYISSLDKDEPFTPGDTVKIDRLYCSREVKVDSNDQITGYAHSVNFGTTPGLDYVYTPTINYVNGPVTSKGALDTVLYSTEANKYPSNGLKGSYWYEYLGAYLAPCYYGYDYDLIASKDAANTDKTGFAALGFRVGDTIEVSGLPGEQDINNKYATIRDIRVTETDGVTNHSLVFDSNTFSSLTATSAVTIARKVPNLSVITMNQNRLWGAEGNTIFASALGDPTNFYTYNGLDTDSYSVAVASEGVFTGCCGFGNSVLFWKEDKLHKLMGAYPSQYTMYEYNVPGVKRGSENSLVNVNEVIYYHGREGVYRYSGGSPDLISKNFGLRRFQKAAAGAESDRYYISMQDLTSKEWGLWVYDILRSIWLQEDESQGVDFAYNEGKLYYISGDGGLMCVNPDNSSEVFEWSATTTRMDEVVHERKYYPKLNIRLDLPVGSTFVVEVSQDDGAFRQIGTFEGTTGKTVILPILLPRCDNFRIRMSGSGPVLIRSIVREYEVGSELF